MLFVSADVDAAMTPGKRAREHIRQQRAGAWLLTLFLIDSGFTPLQQHCIGNEPFQAVSQNTANQQIRVYKLFTSQIN